MSIHPKNQAKEYFHLDDEQVDWVESHLQSMELPERVGQVFMAYMMPSRLSAEGQIDAFVNRIRSEVAHYLLGGYYLNKYYFPSTPMLINLLQEKARIPLLIGADMESGAGGGLGGVIAPSLAQFPPAMAIGATGSERYAFQVGRWTAEQARLVGVNTVFAPSLDVNNNPENPIINVRSFGEDPEWVSRLGSQFIRGLQENGVSACAKHFPGHGDTSGDTHLELCCITDDRRRLDKVELYPYRRAIHEARIDSIMTAHIHAAALDPDQVIPATFSRRVLLDLLRDEFGFQGVIISDALLMGGVTTLCDPGEAAVRALEAGCDLLLMPPDLEAAYQAVLRAVESGRVAPARLEDAVRRLLCLKAKNDLMEFHPTESDEIPAILKDLPDMVSFNIACDAVTLVKNDNGLLPLHPYEHVAVFYLSDVDEELSDQGALLIHAIEHATSKEHHAVLTPSSDASELASARRILNHVDTIIFALDLAVLPEKGTLELPDPLADLIQLAVDEKKNTILISFGNPYILRRFPHVQAYLCAYHYFDNMALAVTEILFGDRIPHGKLPVSIPELYPRGSGESF